MLRCGSMKPHTTLLYDADCGLCRATAAWLGRRVSPRRLRLMALADAAGDPTVGPHVRGRNLASMLHAVTSDGQVFTGARAVLSAGRLVPRWGPIAKAFDHRLGHAVLGPVYQLVARNRLQVSRLLRLPASCPVPTPAERPS
jgi:predicted DCC family thiol-disulfide oxidoreductase YuxK